MFRLFGALMALAAVLVAGWCLLHLTAPERVYRAHIRVEPALEVGAPRSGVTREVWM